MKKLILTMVLLTMLTGLVEAQEVCSTNYCTNLTVISSGGSEDINSTNYNLSITISQVAIGNTSSANFYLDLGFWYTAIEDNTSPYIELGIPVNYTNSTSSTVTFEYNITDDNHNYCDLILNGSIIQTISNTTVSTSYNTGFTEGSYLWYVDCYDEYNNQNESEQRNITFDVTEETPAPSGGGGGGFVEPNVTKAPDDYDIQIGVITEHTPFMFKIVDGAIVKQDKVTGGSIVSVYYDVLVDVEKERYKPDTNIDTEIIIINKGNYDTNGRVTTYFIDPNDVKYKERSAYLSYIPPTCDTAYSWFDDACVNSNMLPKKTIIKRELALPENATHGTWRYYIEFESDNQQLLQTYDAFEVSTIDYTVVIIGSVILGAILLVRIKSVKSKKKVKRRWRLPKLRGIIGSSKERE